MLYHLLLLPILIFGFKAHSSDIVFVNFDQIQNQPQVTDQPYIFNTQDLQRLVSNHQINIANPSSSLLAFPKRQSPLPEMVTKAFTQTETGQSIIFLQSLGTESGGGGSGGVYVNGNYRFLDFFLLPNKFAPPLKTGHTDLISINEEVISLLNLWEEHAQTLVFPTTFQQPLSSRYSALNYILVNELLEPITHYIPPKIKDKASAITTFAIYSPGKSNTKPVFISKKIFTLSQAEQVGIILHEILRDLQMQLNYGFNDQALQMITAILLSCRPETNLAYYIFTLINGNLEYSQSLYGDFESVLEQRCIRYD